MPPGWRELRRRGVALKTVRQSRELDLFHNTTEAVARLRGRDRDDRRRIACLLGSHRERRGHSM